MQGFVDPEDWTFLLTGGLGDAGTIPNPATDWLQDRAWKELGRLAQMPGFKVSSAQQHLLANQCTPHFLFPKTAVQIVSFCYKYDWLPFPIAQKETA